MRKEIRIVQEKVFPGFSGQVFAYGNTKLPKSTLIVNLTSATHCPSYDLGLCKLGGICYAKKCERIYKNYKNKNLAVEEWLAIADDQDILNLLNAYIENAPTPITHLRIDEAGDFMNQGQIQQWNDFAMYLFQRWGIITYTYTHRTDLDFSIATHMIVNGSCCGVKGAKRLFLCIPRQDYDRLNPTKNKYKCPGDCSRCSMCASQIYTGTIFCRQH